MLEWRTAPGDGYFSPLRQSRRPGFVSRLTSGGSDMTTSHEGRPDGRGERAPVSARTVARPCAGTRPESGREQREVTDPNLQDLPDVSGLLARMLDERIPLALIADLASPAGPDSAGIMASERLDVG